MMWKNGKQAQSLEPTSTATSLLAGGVGGDGGAVLDTADLHTSTGQGPEGALGAGSGSLSPVAAGGSQLDVQSSDSQSLDLLGDILSSQHSGVGRGLVAVSLHLHAASHPADGFPAREIGNVDEGVVEGGEDVRNSEHILSLADLRTQRDLDLLLGLLLSLAWSHFLLSLVEVNQAI